MLLYNEVVDTVDTDKVYKVYPFYDANKQHAWMANTAADFKLILPHPITKNLIEWPTSEHYFQACKYLNFNYITAILDYGKKEGEFLSQFPTNAQKIATAMGLKPLGTEWIGTDRQMNGKKHEVMRYVVYEKTKQHAKLKEELLKTEPDSIIVEATGNDQHWGDGGDGSGTNHLGIIWMETRNRWLKEQGQEQEIKIKKPEEAYKEFNEVRKTHQQQKKYSSLYDFPLKQQSELKKNPAPSAPPLPKEGDDLEEINLAFRKRKDLETKSSAPPVEEGKVISRPATPEPVIEELARVEKRVDDIFEDEKEGSLLEQFFERSVPNAIPVPAVEGHRADPVGDALAEGIVAEEPEVGDGPAEGGGDAPPAAAPVVIPVAPPAPVAKVDSKEAAKKPELEKPALTFNAILFELQKQIKLPEGMLYHGKFQIGVLLKEPIDNSEIILTSTNKDYMQVVGKALSSITGKPIILNCSENGFVNIHIDKDVCNALIKKLYETKYKKEEKELTFEMIVQDFAKNGYILSSEKKSTKTKEKNELLGVEFNKFAPTYPTNPTKDRIPTDLSDEAKYSEKIKIESPEADKKEDKSEIKDSQRILQNFVFSLHLLNAKISEETIKGEIDFSLKDPVEILSAISKFIQTISSKANSLTAFSNIEELREIQKKLSDELSDIIKGLEEYKTHFQKDKKQSPSAYLGVTDPTAEIQKADQQLTESLQGLITNLNKLKTRYSVYFIKVLPVSMKSSAEVELTLCKEKISDEEMRDIKEGFELCVTPDNPIKMHMIFISGTGLKMRLSPDQNAIQEISPETVRLFKKIAVAALACTLLINSSKDGTLNIEGYDEELVMFAVGVMELVNEGLSESDKRKYTVKGREDTPEMRQIAKTNVKEFVATHGMDSIKGLAQLVPNITLESRNKQIEEDYRSLAAPAP